MNKREERQAKLTRLHRRWSLRHETDPQPPLDAEDWSVHSLDASGPATAESEYQALATAIYRSDEGGRL